MRILFFSHYFPPEVNAPATRTYEHCRRWVAAGHQVTVVTCTPNCPRGVVYEGYRNAWRSQETMDGIRVVRVWTYLAANQGFFHRLLNYLSYLFSATWCALAMEDVDVVVATSPQFFCGWVGVLCRWLRRWPLVLEIRDIWPESIVAVDAMRPSPMIRLLEWLERRMYAAANHLVTVGEGYRQQLLARGVPAEKISVIPNGVDLSQFAAVDATGPARREPELEGKFVCTYLGTVGMAHGLEVVLEAAEKHRKTGRNDLVFWIVGDGAERHRLQHEAQRRRLDQVVFRGIVPKDQVSRIIASSDACLVHLRGTPLFSTVIPSKIFEIMAMNVPIIMGVKGEAQGIVLEAGAGVPMTADDADSLLDCIAQVAAHRDAYRGGRRYVQRRFNRDRLALQMLEVVGKQVYCPGARPVPSRLDQLGGKQRAEQPEKKAA